MGRRNPSYPPETSSSLRLEPRANRLTKHVVDRFNVAGFHGIERGNLAIRGTWELEAATAYGADRGTKCTGEILGREREEGRGGRRGSRRGGCTRKTGVKSPQKFSTKPLIVLASGERGGKPRIYNVPMANSVPSLLLATLTHRLRIYSCVVKIALQVKTTLPRGGEISSLVSPFFSFLAAFCVARVCQSHDSTSIGPGIYIYICICVKRVVEYVGLALSLPYL